jgi:hypothetical protein
MFKLYEVYMLLPGMANEKLGLEYLVSAATAGHVRAAEMAGLHCVTRDEELARFWLAKAPEHASAQEALDELGQEKLVSGEQYLARIATAMARITVAAPEKVSAE